MSTFITFTDRASSKTPRFFSAHFHFESLVNVEYITDFQLVIGHGSSTYVMSISQCRFSKHFVIPLALNLDHYCPANN